MTAAMTPLLLKILFCVVTSLHHFYSIMPLLTYTSVQQIALWFPILDSDTVQCEYSVNNILLFVS
jgi:hypothetical protein